LEGIFFSFIFVAQLMIEVRFLIRIKWSDPQGLLWTNRLLEKNKGE